MIRVTPFFDSLCICSHLAATDMGRKLGGCALLGEGELGPHLTQCGRAEAYLHAKFHLDPSNRLDTIHQRHRQTAGQRSDSIGRTVLQTVAQKMHHARVDRYKATRWRYTCDQ